MAKLADRYTMVELHNSEIARRLAAATELGLHWFIIRSEKENHSRLYLFFDEQGWTNYLSCVYGNITDEIRASLKLYSIGKITAESALEAIEISLSF